MNLQTRVVIRYLMRKIKWCFRRTFLPWKRKMHCKFEPAIQWECVKSIVEIARKGDVGKDGVLEIVQHAACFAGSAAELLKSRPDAIPDVSPINVDVTFGNPGFGVDEVDVICDKIESCVPGDFTGILDKVDWKEVINTLMPLILSLIQKLMTK